MTNLEKRGFNEILTKLVNARIVDKPDPDDIIVGMKVYQDGSVVKFYAKIDKDKIPSMISKLEQELEQERHFLEITNKKLQNENFVNKAPIDIVELERKKEKDSATRIYCIMKQIEELNSYERTT